MENNGFSALFSQISMSVCWEPVTVVEVSVVSTLKVHSVVRERSAVALVMNSPTITTAKVSHIGLRLPVGSCVLFMFVRVDRSVCNDNTTMMF